MTTMQMDNVCPPQWHTFFRAIWPQHTRKELQRAGNMSERRARYLVEGKTSPTADEMFELSRRCPRVQRELWRVWMSARKTEQLARESKRLDALDAEDGI